MSMATDKKSLFSFWHNLRGRYLVLILALLGIVLLIFGSRLSATGQSGQESADTGVEEYRAALREEIRGLCESVGGVGRVRAVMVVLGSGERSVYAQNADGSYIVSGGNGLLLRRDSPDIAGIGVVCDGGGNAAVCAELISLLSATLGIPSNHIHISPS